MLGVLRSLEPLFLPPALIAVGMLFCFISLAVRERAGLGKAAMAALFGIYYLSSTWPLAGILASTLEGQFPASTIPSNPGAAEVIVILAGNAAPATEGRRRGELNEASWRRLLRGIELHSEFGRTVPILFSGGSGYLSKSSSNAATLAQESARQWGIREGHFWVEDRSRNTYESGIEVKRILGNRFPTKVRHRIVLVTSAWHMPRAVGVFNRLGIDVIPAPCDYLSGSSGISIRGLVPSYEALSAFSLAFREWMGIAVYRLQGRI